MDALDSEHDSCCDLGMDALVIDLNKTRTLLRFGHGYSGHPKLGMSAVVIELIEECVVWA